MHRRDFITAVASAALAGAVGAAPQAATARAQSIDAIRRFAQANFLSWASFDGLSQGDVQGVLTRLSDALHGNFCDEAIRAAVAAQIERDMVTENWLQVGNMICARTDAVLQRLASVGAEPVEA